MGTTTGTRVLCTQYLLRVAIIHINVEDLFRVRIRIGVRVKGKARARAR
jgi:hypothetical protein